VGHHRKDVWRIRACRWGGLSAERPGRFTSEDEARCAANLDSVEECVQVASSLRTAVVAGDAYRVSGNVARTIAGLCESEDKPTAYLEPGVPHHSLEKQDW
jgi:hypothetical protein